MTCGTCAIDDALARTRLAQPKTGAGLTRGWLLTSGRLPLDMLAAYRTSLPPARHWPSPGPGPGPGPASLLWRTGPATFEPLTGTRPADGEVGNLVCGAGKHVGTVLAALAGFGDQVTGPLGLEKAPGVVSANCNEPGGRSRG
ncbi:MAG: hypothetical protein M3Q10_00465 [Chloroflexota bacterium]|nr:hypothetical protein [Chloroflexota bacterium]